MAVLYKAAMTGQVLLTAIMTLFAGTPHWSCLCPNGKVKTVCVSVAAHPSCCCCAGGNCCAASNPEVKSCCATHRKLDETRQSQVQPDRKCCVRTLDQLTDTAVSYFKTTAEKDFSHTPVLIQTIAPSNLQRTDLLSVWQTNLLTPPTDLVDVLQHYLI